MLPTSIEKNLTKIKSKVTHINTIKSWEEDVLCVRFDPTDSKVAYGCGDGYLRIYDISSEEVSPYLADAKYKKDYQMPITCICWKPLRGSEQATFITACSSNGFIYEWNLNPEELPKKNTEKEEIFGELVSSTLEENENMINCIDFSPEGDTFATGGSDAIIRLYDDNTKKVITKLQGQVDHNIGHSNRIFCLKYNPENPNMLISGAWDNTVLIWDIRQETPVSHIYGYNISGESIDIKGSKLLIGSFDEKDNLNVFDLETLEIESEIQWSKNKSESEHPPCLYSSKFTKTDDNYIIAGGSNSNEIKIFEDIGEHEYKSLAKIKGMAGACISIDWANHSNNFAVGCADGSLKLYKIEEH